MVSLESSGSRMQQDVKNDDIELIPVIVSALCTGELDVCNTRVGGMSSRVDGSL